MNTFFKSIVQAGLTRQMLIWFLFISLVPLGIVSWWSYRKAYDQLYRNAEQSLYNISTVQSLNINNNFKQITTNLVQESGRVNNINFLSALRKSLKSSQQEAAEFVESYDWAVLVDEWSPDLVTFWKEYGYYDIYLIDPEGNILYSVTGEKDLGQNLFHGKLAETRFAKAAQQTLLSGKITFSDLEHYTPKEDLLSGCLLSPIIDEFGNKIGLIAVQIAKDKLIQLITQRKISSSTGEWYIIGSDLTLRSPGALGDEYPVLYKPVTTELTTNWKQEHIEKDLQFTIKNEKVSLYKGPHGKEVLGLHTDIRIPGVSWGYIAEIPVDEALLAAIKLARETLILIFATVLLVIIFTFVRTRRIVGPIVEISKALTKVGQGERQQQIDIKADHELDTLVHGFNGMIQNLQVAEKETEEQRWLQEGMNLLNENMQGDQDLAGLARKTIRFLCQQLDVPTGAFYVVTEKQIRLRGSYAFSSRKGFRNEFILGEGIVGQAVLETQTLEISDLPKDYMTVSSGLGESVPRYINVIPLVWNNEVAVVLEFCLFNRMNSLQKKFIDMITPAISVAIQTALSRTQTIELLEKTQVQAEELQAREEELRDSNRLLEQQAKDLQQSEKILQRSQAELEEKNEQLGAQQEELRVTNEELEERAHDLKNSRDQIVQKNRELEEIQQILKQKADDLKVSSKYKSEFLANMSHELRTPLNSLLILAKLLSENRDGNLTEKQIEFSHTIHDSGSELLHLINEILDLSKIEAGRMDIYIEPIHLDDFVANLQRNFNPLAEQKNIDFRIESHDAPPLWRSDRQKLDQIMKNLLSNAFKFTSKGYVLIRITPLPADIQLSKDGLTPENSLAISVSDTGIGIPRERANIIFEAFQQVDGTTSRKYGGTGLGLTISRELTRLLGGEIRLVSEEGSGSTFTLYIPLELTASLPADKEGKKSEGQAKQASLETTSKDKRSLSELKQGQNSNIGAITTDDMSAPSQGELKREVADDRNEIKPKDRSILIIEDDPRFANILINLAKARGFKVLVAEDGEVGLHLADYYLPSGIILDIGLPGKDGWEVIEQIKDNSRTRHIPVHFMSASDFSADAMKKGAIGFLTKPVSMEEMEGAISRIEDVIDRSMKRLLIVEDNPTQLMAIRELIGNGDVHTVTASTGAEALKLISGESFDCIILDYGLPDMSGLQLLELFRDKAEMSQTPVIIYTGKELEPLEKTLLENYSQSLIIKSVHSEERLLDDTTLFLHRVESNLPEAKQRILRMLHDREATFEDRKVLLVDDDMRNVFALSAIIQEKKMQVVVANNGNEALLKLEENPDVAIVLMDIMMPEMDGYEATRRIRAQERFADLPIIALTAKAMKGDRAKCIDNGASDYLAKPVDTDKLFSMMRVWLYQK